MKRLLNRADQRIKAIRSNTGEQANSDCERNAIMCHSLCPSLISASFDIQISFSFNSTVLYCIDLVDFVHPKRESDVQSEKKNVGVHDGWTVGNLACILNGRFSRNLTWTQCSYKLKQYLGICFMHTADMLLYPWKYTCM